MPHAARLTALSSPSTDRWPLASTVSDPRRGPLPAGSPAGVLRRTLDALGEPRVPAAGVGESAALALVRTLLGEGGIDLRHPYAAAHLQPPVLRVAVEADALASAGNASMDTYDSGPATLAIERWVVRSLAGLAGFGAAADGVLTPGRLDVEPARRADRARRGRGPRRRGRAAPRRARADSAGGVLLRARALLRPAGLRGARPR